jgi:Kef-type K+ transport system membrane component KefB/Trk K+ transport system NAD-binding subunit
MSIFVEIGLIIFIATAISFLMRMLKQPLIVGYILSGILLGPYVFNLIQSSEYMEAFAKIGIAILLFIVGLNLKPDVVREVGRVSLITGVGQIVVTSILSFFLMRFIGFEMVASIYGAIAITFSSTIIVLKLLSDKGDLDKLYGKISIGFLLVQDVVATIILLGVSIFSKSSVIERNFGTAFFLAIKCVAFFFALYLISKFVLPKISKFLIKSPELLFLFSITWGLGLAAIFYLFGFSLEIGALAAGVALSSFNFSQEIASRMKSLRDFFILIFFVLLGSQMIFTDIGHIILPALVISFFVLVIKPMIVFLIMNILGYGNRTSFSASLAIAQISEFSLILVGLGLSFGHISREIVSMITLVGIITIAGSTYLILYSDRLYVILRSLLHFIEFNKKPKFKEENQNEVIDMIVLGYDRVGYDFVKIAKKMAINYFVVDFDPTAINKLKSEDIPCFFGDADDVDFLDEIGIKKAKIVVSTIPDFKTNLSLVSYCKNHNPNGIVIVISHNIRNTQELYSNGASFVVMPHYLGAKHASHMIENFAFRKEAFEEEKKHHLEYLEERQKKTE